MKKKYKIVSIIVIALIIFGVWINNVGLLWTNYRDEYYSLQNFIKAYNKLPKSKQEFEEFLQQERRSTKPVECNYLIINYNLQVDNLKYTNGRILDITNKPVVLASPPRKLIVLFPISWFYAEKDSNELYKMLKQK